MKKIVDSLLRFVNVYIIFASYLVGHTVEHNAVLVEGLVFTVTLFVGLILGLYCVEKLKESGKLDGLEKLVKDRN